MTKTKLVLSTAIIAQAIAFAATPAIAGTEGAPTQADLDASCAVFLHADVNGGFMAKAINGARVTDSVNTTESEHVFTYDGEPTLDGLKVVSLSRNPGNTSNIFGNYAYTTQTFPSGTESWTETTVTEYHVNYDCKIFKVNKAGKEVVPDDKQRPGQVSASWTETVTEDKSLAITGGTVELDERVPAPELKRPVCQYKKNPGIWIIAQDSGYDESQGDCSQATYDSTATW